MILPFPFPASQSLWLAKNLPTTCGLLSPTVVDESLIKLVLLPTILIVLKTLLSQEISYWTTLVGCYFHRPFDVDNNPASHDWAMIFNPASGEWECCSLTFHFGFWKNKNGVFIHHYDNKWNHCFSERKPFDKWRQTNKGKLTDVSMLNGLELKIGNSTHP